MSALFNHVMCYEWAEKNPIRLVRQSAKRERTPDVLTAKEIRALLSELQGPYYVMAVLAALTGLRVSELLAFKWEDVDFAAGEIRLTRAIVCQHVGSLKTAASQKPIPMDAGLSALLLDWRGCCPYNQDLITCSHRLRRKALNRSGLPVRCRNTSDPLQSEPGLRSTFAWHVFSHSFATLLKGNGEDVKTVQESLRHADSKVTLDVYTEGRLMPVTRAAQRKVIQMIVPIRSHELGIVAVSA